MANSNLTPDAKPGGQIWKEEQVYVDSHQEVIDKVVKEISDTILDPKYDAADPHWTGIVKAKNDQLVELDNQLNVYKTVLARAGDCQFIRLRESYRFSHRLPAFGKRNDIDDFIEAFEPDNRFLIVQGQTGSGKSTQLPQYIADHPRMSGKKVICTQPRKIAAISLAERVSFEYSCGDKKSKTGLQVGYSVGGSKPKSSKGKTRIEFMTEGRMLERLMNRREDDFKNIGAIIIDEAHERSIVCDILLGTLKKNDPLWKDILIVVASATIDLKAFEAFFNKRAKIVEIAGRMYPVRRIYRPLPEAQAGKNNELGENGDIIKGVAEIALEIHNSAGTDKGDILCFLPGAEEVHRAGVYFQNNLNRKSDVNKKRLTAKIYELSGRQEADEQKEVFEELDPKVYRKVIFASPIAETSITIDGVIYVVDSGYKKEMTFDPKRNISALQTVTISQSSSLQREGRAGRTQPGVCYKLYSEEDFRNMNINHLPEIFRRPLPLAIIYLRKMGIDPVRFDWVSAPELETIRSAEEELIILGAIDKENKVPTDLGNLISFSQQEPKTVRMIYSGMKKELGMAAIRIAALLSVSKLFFVSGGKDAKEEIKEKHMKNRKELSDKDGDILTMFKVYNEYESLVDANDGSKQSYQKVRKLKADYIQDNSLSRKAFQTASSTVRDLEFIFSKTKQWSEKCQDSEPTDEDVLQLFCSGYFLHAARKVNIKGKGQTRLNYFALETEVVGNVPFKASLKQAADESDGFPDWIIYDQILKYPDSTVFPTSSRIELEWVQRESEEFYEKCLAKQKNLPTEVVEIKESETVLRAVLGRRLVYLPRYEEELNCSLIADMYVGCLRAFCSKGLFPFVEHFFKTEVERAKENINNERCEETWMSNTRLVIGPGYEISTILFAGEYDCIRFGNLPKNLTRSDLEQFIFSNISEEKVVIVEMIYQERTNVGKVRLKKMSDAVWLLSEVKDFVKMMGDDVYVAPVIGDTSTGTVPRGEELKLKISWPLGPSTGVVNVILESPGVANKTMDVLKRRYISIVTNAVGDSSSKESFLNNKAKIHKINKQWRFFEDVEYAEQPVFKIKAKDIPFYVDEYEITKYLKQNSITPVRVFIERKEVREDLEELDNHPLDAQGLLYDSDLDDLVDQPQNPKPKLLSKKQRLAPVHAVLGKKNLDFKEFTDKASRRAGVFVYYPDSIAVEKALLGIKVKYSKMKEFNQKFRVELERLYTFSVHSDLYRCLKPKFKEAVKEIKKLNVWVYETGPGTGNKKDGAAQRKGKFVYIKFRTTDNEILWKCRRILEAVIERDSIGDLNPNVGNLFTWTGRLIVMEEIPAKPENYYMHWDYRNRQVFIYGMDLPSRLMAMDKLHQIIERIEKWKQAECFEVPILLDRKTLETFQNKNPKYIDSLCQRFKFTKGQYRLVGIAKLIVSADSKEDIEKFRKHLDANKLLMAERKRNVALSRECKLCYCDVDQKFMVTSLCNHDFCMECIQHMFDGVTVGAGMQKMPICCPADKCDRPIPIQDLKKIVKPQAVPKLNEIALDIYLRSKNGSSIRFCPKPGCNQVFRPNTQGGGPTFYFCDNCSNDFCLECTEFLGKEVHAHRGRSCDEMRVSEDDVLRRLLNKIRDEILCLRCPRCKTTFNDFDGCAALTCGNSSCKAAFCAFCLMDCGADAHAHVVNCPLNERRHVFASLDSVSKANRKYRIDKLSEFFRDSPDLKQSTAPDVSLKLLNALKRDLEDLKIDIREIRNVRQGENAADSIDDEKLLKWMNQIRDEILTLSCPNCSAAFFDYEGCAAVTCELCRTSFCALCLEDCGDETDSFIHVTNCRFNKNRDLSVDQDDVNKANRHYRIKKLLEFFEVTPEIRGNRDLKVRLLTALQRDLNDLGMKFEDVEEQESYNEFLNGNNQEFNVDHLRGNVDRPIANVDRPRGRGVVLQPIRNGVQELNRGPQRPNPPAPRFDGGNRFNVDHRVNNVEQPLNVGIQRFGQEIQRHDNANQGPNVGNERAHEGNQRFNHVNHQPNHGGRGINFNHQRLNDGNQIVNRNVQQVDAVNRLNVARQRIDDGNQPVNVNHRLVNDGNQRVNYVNDQIIHLLRGQRLDAVNRLDVDRQRGNHGIQQVIVDQHRDNVNHLRLHNGNQRLNDIVNRQFEILRNNRRLAVANRRVNIGNQGVNNNDKSKCVIL